MKKSRLLVFLLTVLTLVFSAYCYAEDLASKVGALENQAKRVQSLIDQAKNSSNESLNNQIQGLRGSIDALMKQRVAVDAQIARLEGQIAEMKEQAQAGLTRQVSNYNEELQKIKGQIAGMMSETKKQAAANVQAPVSNSQAEPGTPAAKQ